MISVDEVYPTKDWVLLKPHTQAYVTAAGLYVQEERFTPEIRWGLVVAVGPDAREALIAGDMVFCDGQQRRELELDEGKFWLVPEEWIFAKEVG